jgi:MFS family permease
MAATYVVNAMDRIVFATLLPNVAEEYAFTLAAGGFLATIFTLGLGAAGIPGGFLLDRMSRKAIAVVGICVYSVCTILTCLSFGFYDMAFYRIVSGIGEAFQNAAIFTIAGAYFAPNRTLAFGVLNFAYGIGSFIGPRWAAYLLVESGTWRLPLYVYGAIGMASALAMLSLPSRFTEWRVVETQADAAKEDHIPDTLINRNTMLVAIAAIGAGIAGNGYLGLYPTFLRGELGFTVEAAGTAASMYGVGALTGVLCGYLADRVDQKRLTILGLVALGLVGYAIFNIATTLRWQSILSFLQGVALSGCLYLNNYSLMQRSVRFASTGRASGLVVCCVYLPAAFSGYLFAALAGWVGWNKAALIQMSLLLIAPAIAMLSFDLTQTSCKVQRRPRLGLERLRGREIA